MPIHLILTQILSSDTRIEGHDIWEKKIRSSTMQLDIDNYSGRKIKQNRMSIFST